MIILLIFLKHINYERATYSKIRKPARLASQCHQAEMGIMELKVLNALKLLYAP